MQAPELWKARLLCWLRTLLKGHSLARRFSLLTADLQAHILCPKLRRLTERLVVGVDKFPTYSFHWWWRGFCAFTFGGMQEGPIWTCGLLPPASCCHMLVAS